MKHIRVLNYKYTGKWLNWSISIWTGLFNKGTPPYSHSEIWFHREDRFKSKVDETVFTGECFTSTMRGDVNGTVLRSAYMVVKHPERWEYFEISVEDNVYDQVYTKAKTAALANEGYDKPALLSFFFPVRFGSGVKDICSEVTYRALCWAGIFKKPAMPSPRRQARWLMDLGYEIHQLA